MRLLPLGALVVWMVGCQGTPPKAETPTVVPEAAAPTKPAQTQEAKPVPAEGHTPVAKPQEAEAKVVAGVPKITVEKDTIDLGRIGLSTRHKGQFKFTNTGTAPLKITLVQGCCGVTVKGVEVGQQYAPGQTGTLDFDYTTPEAPGVGVLRKLYLQSNDPNQKITTLTLKADIVRRIICKPEVLRLVTNKPNADCPDITISSLDDQSFSITGVQSTAGAITAEFNPTVKDTDFTLKLKADLTKLEQDTRGQISISLTHPDCNNVRVLYDVLAEYTISTPTIMMFGLKAGQAVQREFWVLNNYQENFEIESVASQKGLIKLLEKTKVTDRYQIKVEITPPAHKPEETLTSDTLEIKIKNGRTLTVPFRGFYQDK